MDTLLIAGGRIITPDGSIDDGAVLIQAGRIACVGPSEPMCQLEVDRTIDASGCIVAPGYIDMHIHGAAGADVMDASREALSTMASFAASRGVTGFLPTVMSSPLEQMTAACQAVAQYIESAADNSSINGAQVLGINVEGPFFNTDARGAQPAEGIYPPCRDVLEAILDAGNDHVRVMSVAPEMPGALDIIEALNEMGILASIGHTQASFDQTAAAAQAGARLTTHTFNAMRGLHHREPGTVGAALTIDELSCEAIADGIHLHPAAAALIARAKGCGRTVLITDAMRAAGLPDGVYDLARQRVTVTEGAARLDNGSLAGSTLTIDRAVANMARFARIPIEEAISMASSTPARLIGLGDTKGRIERGMDGDIVILSHDLQVRTTIAMGTPVYGAGS